MSLNFVLMTETRSSNLYVLYSISYSFNALHKISIHLWHTASFDSGTRPARKSTRALCPPRSIGRRTLLSSCTTWPPPTRSSTSSRCGIRSSPSTARSARSSSSSATRATWAAALCPPTPAGFAHELHVLCSSLPTPPLLTTAFECSMLLIHSENVPSLLVRTPLSSWAVARILVTYTCYEHLSLTVTRITAIGGEHRATIV